MPSRAPLVAALLALTLSVPAAAARREAGKHQHGAGELRVAIDGNAVEVELEGPAANFIGFEYRPRTAAEQQRLAEALATLRAPDRLFAWPAAAGCTLVASDVTPPDYGHDAGKARDGDGDHEDHSEFTAVYTFRCAKPAALDQLRVLVFARFPATATLAADVVGPNGQSGASLKPSAPVLTLRP